MKSGQRPRVTFGLIVLNGEPFTRYCLRALYLFAHEIIVVEGACEAAAAVATADGHSTDGTLETLRRFKAEEDPEDKVHILTREGFWSEKDEQSQAYAKLATGDYLWQVDIDEFYQPEDIKTVLEMLRVDPAITAVSFHQITFWGGLDYITDSWYLRRGAGTYHRLFKWGPAYRYVAHRPPTVRDSSGRDQRALNWVTGRELAKRGIFLYHYSLLFPKQVIEKSSYYGQAGWAIRGNSLAWAYQNYFGLQNPFRVHNVYDYPSWLERFEGRHPPQIEALWRDLQEKRLSIEVRCVSDIEDLLCSRRYRLSRTVMKLLGYGYCWFFTLSYYLRLLIRLCGGTRRASSSRSMS